MDNIFHYYYAHNKNEFTSETDYLSHHNRWWSSLLINNILGTKPITNFTNHLQKWNWCFPK